MREANLSDFLGLLSRGQDERPDAVLVEMFLAGRDEAAFEALVRRHGAMVYRVCLQVAAVAQDAEDAFQATFLVLAQGLGAVRKRASLASWLHGVARRVALKARARAAARRRHERRAARREVIEAEGAADLHTAVEAELGGLPDRLRPPLVLCDMQGRTQEETAAELGWSKSTVRRRLDEGRAAFRRRWQERGLGTAALPAGLVGPTVTAAVAVAAGGLRRGGVTEGVAALAEGAMTAMPMKKVGLAAALLLLAGLLAVGAVASQAVGKGDKAGPKENTAKKDEKAGDVLVKDRGYLVYAVTTDLHRALLPDTDLLVLLDTTDAMGAGGPNLDGLRLPALRKALAPHKKATSRLHFNLFYKQSQADRAGRREALRYGALGFGEGMGFAKVTAHGTYMATDITWAEYVLPFTKPARQPRGDERTAANKLVKVYPVRTELSRYLTSDADCAVVIPKLGKHGGAIPKAVRQAITDLVNGLKLDHQTRISFHILDRHSEDDPHRERMLEAFYALAEELGFKTSTVTQ